MTPWIVDFPKECEVVQRREDGRADMPVRVYDPELRAYKAEMPDVDEITLEERGRATMAGVFKDVPAGDYRLVLHGEDVVKVIDRVGVGDVHGAIGQSHVAGRAWTLFRSRDGRTTDPTNANDKTLNLARDGHKVGGDGAPGDEHDPEGRALGSWMPGLGDFLTEHWGAPQKFLNFAVGGSLSEIWQPGAGAYVRAVNAFENAGARYVMYNIGASDTMAGAGVGELKERMAVTIKDLQERGFTVLLGRMPLGLREGEWNECMKRQQQAAAELWEEIPGLYPGGDMARLDPKIHVNKVDGVHMNAAGYLEAVRLWGEAYKALPVPPAG